MLYICICSSYSPYILVNNILLNQSILYSKTLSADFLSSNNIEYRLLDINEQENFNKLMKIGKKRQVPFIVDTNTGNVMYESADIIDYLSKEYL